MDACVEDDGAAIERRGRTARHSTRRGIRRERRTQRSLGEAVGYHGVDAATRRYHRADARRRGRLYAQAQRRTASRWISCSIVNDISNVTQAHIHMAREGRERRHRRVVVPVRKPTRRRLPGGGPRQRTRSSRARSRRPTSGAARGPSVVGAPRGDQGWQRVRERAHERWRWCHEHGPGRLPGRRSSRTAGRRTENELQASRLGRWCLWLGDARELRSPEGFIQRHPATSTSTELPAAVPIPGPFHAFRG